MKAGLPGERRKARSGHGNVTGRGGSTVAGGRPATFPCSCRPALQWLQPRDGGFYIDGTFGAGGYTPGDP